MTSLYAFYLKERENLDVLETETGFAIYLILDELVYLKDIYVVPAARRQRQASIMADEVGRIAKNKGCKTMMGTVCPQANGATESLKALLAYGFKLTQSSEVLIVFSKDL